MNSNELDELDKLIKKKDYNAALSKISSLYAWSTSTKDHYIHNLNRLFIQALYDQVDETHFIISFQSLLNQMWNYIDFDIELYSMVMIDCLYVLGMKYGILYVNQFFNSFIIKLKESFHIQQNDHRIFILANCIKNQIPNLYNRFMNLLFFMLAIWNRYGIQNSEKKEILSFLSSHFYSFSLLQQAYLHYLQPHTLFYESEKLPSSWYSLFHSCSQPNWVSLYQAIQSNQQDQAISILLSLLPDYPDYSPIILYNLILLSNHSQISSLLPLFLSHLSPSYSLTTFPVLHPQSYPITKPLSPFLYQNILLKLCSDVYPPSLIQSILPYCTDLSNCWLAAFQVILSIQQYQSIQQSTLHSLQQSTHPIHQFLFYYGQVVNALLLQQVDTIDDLSFSLLQSIQQLPLSSQEFFQSLVEKLLFCYYQSKHTSLAVEKMMELQDIHSTCSLYQDIHPSEVYYVYNVCIGLLKQKEVLRCCLLWSRFWKQDIVNAIDISWYENRMKENQSFQTSCTSITRQIIILDSFVWEYWRKRLAKKDLLCEILAMEEGLSTNKN